MQSLVIGRELGNVMAKLFSHTRASTRKIKTKTGQTKRVAVKSHNSKINRKPRKK
jgi:hypothetical protein